MTTAVILANAATILPRPAAANQCNLDVSNTTEERVWNVLATTNSKAACVPSKGASNRHRVCVLNVRKTSKK